LNKVKKQNLIGENILNLVYGALILPFLVVITRDQIIADNYIGMPGQEALAYFQNLTDSESVLFRTISTPKQTVGHDIRENEIGYFVIYIDNVRDHCGSLRSELPTAL
tara:strand:- start:455 stop:778 length:324 start_codon:yes stop_codon:yes gene_type:complete